MLPCDLKVRRAAQQELRSQTLVKDFYEVQKPEEKPIPYSNELFKEDAVQWLVETDQVLFYCQHSYILSLIFITRNSLFKPSNTLPFRK